MKDRLVEVVIDKFRDKVDKTHQLPAGVMMCVAELVDVRPAMPEDGDFTTYEHKTTTRQGGKGGGGVKQEDVKYTYEAAVMMALCEGEIKGVTRIWRDKEKFSSPASLRLTLYKGGEEQPVWPHLQQAKHAVQAISYSGTAYLCSPNYELTKSAQIYSHNFEVDGKLGYSTSIVDANLKPLAALAVIGLLFGAWQADRTMQYRKGRADEAAKISLTLAEAANKQAAAAREKERRAAVELAERQTELEKERQDAEKSIGAMRLELDRLRQHAARQSGRRNLPATAATAAAPDGAASAEGWELLGECAAEYAGLAETADGQAADLREWQAYGGAVSQ